MPIWLYVQNAPPKSEHKRLGKIGIALCMMPSQTILNREREGHQHCSHRVASWHSCCRVSQLNTPRVTQYVHPHPHPYMYKYRYRPKGNRIACDWPSDANLSSAPLDHLPAGPLISGCTSNSWGSTYNQDDQVMLLVANKGTWSWTTDPFQSASAVW